MAAVDKPRRRASSPSVQMMMDMDEDRENKTFGKAEEVNNFADGAAAKDVAKILCGNMPKKGYGGLDAPKPAPAIIKKMGMDGGDFSRQTTGETDIPWSRETTPFTPQTTSEVTEPTTNVDTYDVVVVEKPRKRASSPSMQMMQDFGDDHQPEEPVRRSSKFVDDNTAKDMARILSAAK